MYKIGVVGDRGSILGFKALGIDIFPCAKTEEAKAVISELVKNDYAVIYITEDFAAELTKETDKYKDARLPAIVPIPNKSGPTGRGMDNLKKSVERAVGADILFGGEK